MYWDCSFRPKGENVDVKTVGMDEGNGEYLSFTTFYESVFMHCVDSGGKCHCVSLSSGVQQCFVVFDVLMINDNNLANCPLRERAEHLKK